MGELVSVTWVKAEEKDSVMKWLCHRQRRATHTRATLTFFSSLFLQQLLIFVFSLTGVLMDELSQPCHMMLLVNPQSGKGQALTLYNNHIQRMLNEAGVPHTLVITGELKAQVHNTHRYTGYTN